MEEDILRKVVISCTSHKGLTPYTLRSIQACPHVAVSLSVGFAEVSLARNLQVRDALTMALRDGRSLILFVDDDIVFKVDQVRAIAREALERGGLCSGVYAVGDFERDDIRIAAAPIANAADRWVTGLGFIAAPVELLVSKLEEFPIVSWKDETFHLVTWSGPAAATMGDNPLMWISEDYRFCMRLGSVHLCQDIRLGHAKLVPFYPPEEDA